MGSDNPRTFKCFSFLNYLSVTGTCDKLTVSWGIHSSLYHGKITKLAPWNVLGTKCLGYDLTGVTRAFISFHRYYRYRLEVKLTEPYKRQIIRDKTGPSCKLKVPVCIIYKVETVIQLN